MKSVRQSPFRSMITGITLCLAFLITPGCCVQIYDRRAPITITKGKNCHEYTIHKLSKHQRPGWEQSKRFCSDNGGHLVCIENQEELDFLASKLKEEILTSEYFIGLEEQNGTWTWICNRSIVVTPWKRRWAKYEPNWDGRCAKMYFFGNVLVYDDISCDRKQDFICERRLSSCHKQAFVNNCHEYTVHEFPLQQRPVWLQSNDFCSQNGGHLVCIEQQEKLNFLVHKLRALKMRSEYFIGLEKQNGSWNWICNRSIVVTPEKTPWAEYQPNGSGSCGKMFFYTNNDTLYDDIPCENYKLDSFICERRISSCNEKAGPVTADEKQSAKPSTVQTLPATQSREDSEITTPAKDVGDYTSSSDYNVMTTPTVTNFKKVQNLCTGKLSDPLWMIAALVGWTVVVVFLWLLLRKEARAFCPPGKHSSLKSRKKRNHLGKPNLPDQKSGGTEEEVTFMNLTEIRSQMSEQGDGYAALNIHKNMSPNDATYSSLLPSGQGNSIKRSTEENHLQENTRK